MPDIALILTLGLVFVPGLSLQIPTTVTPPHPPERDSDVVYIISMTTWGVTILVGAVGNVLLCVTIGLNSSLHTAMNIYVFSIGLVDLVTCLGLLPMRIALEGVAHQVQDVSSIAENVAFFLRVFTDVGRLLLMQSLTLERYQAIANPFAVTKSQARRRAKMVILVQGIFSMVIAALSVCFLCDTTQHQHCQNHFQNTAMPNSTTRPSRESVNNATTPTTITDVITTASIDVNVTKDVLSSDWGLLETSVELPLTIVTVFIIFSSYIFILTISKQQKKKLSGTTYNNAKVKANQVSPAADVKETFPPKVISFKDDNPVADVKETFPPKVISSKYDNPAADVKETFPPKVISFKDDNPAADVKETFPPKVISSKDGNPVADVKETFPTKVISSKDDKSKIDNRCVSSFMEIIEPRSSEDNVSSPKSSDKKTSHKIQEGTGDNRIQSLSFGELRESVVNVTQRKYSHPGKGDNDCHCEHKAGITNENGSDSNTGEFNQLRISTLFYDQPPLRYRRSSLVHLSLDDPISLVQQGMNNPIFDRTDEMKSPKRFESDTKTGNNNSITHKRVSLPYRTETDSKKLEQEINSESKNKEVTRLKNIKPENHSQNEQSTSNAVDESGKREETTVSEKPEDNGKVLDGAVCIMTNKNKLLGRRGVELKAAFKVGFLFCCFVCLWMPFPVSVTVIRASSINYQTSLDTAAILSSLATCTAAMDAIVYGLLNQQIVDRLVGLKKTCRRRFAAVLCR